MMLLLWLLMFRNLFLQAVQQVMSNLLISHIELRSEDSADIKPYTHKRTVEKVVVPLGDELTTTKIQYTKVIIHTLRKHFCDHKMWLDAAFLREANKLNSCKWSTCMWFHVGHFYTSDITLIGWRV